MTMQKIRTFTLGEMKDKYLGESGTVQRDRYEQELRMDLLGHMIKAARQQRNWTQEELGLRIGVGKARISKLERSANSASMETLLRVFEALQAEVHFNIRMEGKNLTLNGKLE
jgi:HTH-type transcriptional regulator / antitoxin HipB